MTWPTRKPGWHCDRREHGDATRRDVRLMQVDQGQLPSDAGFRILELDARVHRDHVRRHQRAGHDSRAVQLVLEMFSGVTTGRSGATRIRWSARHAL